MVKNTLPSVDNCKSTLRSNLRLKALAVFKYKCRSLGVAIYIFNNNLHLFIVKINIE